MWSKIAKASSCSVKSKDQRSVWWLWRGLFTAIHVTCVLWPYKRAKNEHIILFNFRLFRLHHPVVRRPLSLLAVVVRPPPRVVASSAPCSPCVVGYRPSTQQHRRRHCHCVLIPPPPSLVTRLLQVPHRRHLRWYHCGHWDYCHWW